MLADPACLQISRTVASRYPFSAKTLIAAANKFFRVEAVSLIDIDALK